MENDKHLTIPATAGDRELIVAYLSYVLEDVRALSERGTQLLLMAIATLNEEQIKQTKEAPLPFRCN